MDQLGFTTIWEWRDEREIRRRRGRPLREPVVPDAPGRSARGTIRRER